MAGRRPVPEVPHRGRDRPGHRRARYPVDAQQAEPRGGPTAAEHRDRQDVRRFRQDADHRQEDVRAPPVPQGRRRRRRGDRARRRPLTPQKTGCRLRYLWVASRPGESHGGAWDSREGDHMRLGRRLRIGAAALAIALVAAACNGLTVDQRGVYTSTSPTTITGTVTVSDGDSLVSVKVNGVTATVDGEHYSADVPLDGAAIQNAVLVEATYTSGAVIRERRTVV